MLIVVVECYAVGYANFQLRSEKHKSFCNEGSRDTVSMILERCRTETNQRKVSERGVIELGKQNVSWPNYVPVLHSFILTYCFCLFYFDLMFYNFLYFGLFP